MKSTTVVAIDNETNESQAVTIKDTFVVTVDGNCSIESITPVEDGKQTITVKGVK